MEFIRYGSLVAQDHNVIEKERWYHSAPVKKGFYAFPKGYIEMFLLGGVGSGNIANGRYRYVRDENGNKLCGKRGDFITEDYDYATDKYIKAPIGVLGDIVKKHGLDIKDIYEYAEDERGIRQSYIEDDACVFVVIENKPNRFSYNGNIWHHLYKYGKTKLCSEGDIIRRVIDTDVSGEGGEPFWIETDMKTYQKCLKKYVYLKKREQMRDYKMSGNVSGMPVSSFSKDDFEVYIEKL